MKAIFFALFLSGAPDAGVACFDNLCGMDSWCSCHLAFTPEYQGQARCYANTRQCEIDLKCCTKTSCKGSPRRGDACTDVVIAAVHKDGGSP